MYDNKVFAQFSDYFGRTDLGKVYEKCLNDNKLKYCVNINFDIDHGFVNYHGSELLAHYHEAAYDAYMTRYSFLKINKFKEVNVKCSGGNEAQGNPKNSLKSEEEKKEDKEKFSKMKSIQKAKVDPEFEFCKKYLNKVMMSYGDTRLYYLDPAE